MKKIEYVIINVNNVTAFFRLFFHTYFIARFRSRVIGNLIIGNVVAKTTLTNFYSGKIFENAYLILYRQICIELWLSIPNEL